MVIVHLLAPAMSGGLERVVHGLAIGQAARGHEVVVLAVADESLDDHPFAVPLTRAGVPMATIRVARRAYWQERRQVRAQCQHLAPDIVHSHGYHTDVVDGAMIRKLGIPTVSSAHGFTGGPWRNRIYEHLHRRALRRFDAVIAVSRPLAAQLSAAGVPANHIHVVPNAWTEIAPPLTRFEARRSLDLPQEALVVGWVGRMTYEKGLDVLLEAVAIMPEVPLLVSAIGDGPERIRVARHAAPLGDRVRWAGFRPEAGRLCRAFDVFVLSSRSEGIPIALLEAMAAGVPIVATRVGGIPDILGESEGWLVPPAQPEVLAGAIRAALEDPGTAARRAQAASRRLAHKLGPDSWLDAHETVYATAIGNATNRE